MTDWKRLFNAEEGYQLQPGARASEVAAAEETLTAAFPPDLKDVYLVSNGVFDTSGQWFVIWPLSEVTARNQQAWSTGGSSQRHVLVGFGDDGTGAPFCVPRDGGIGVFAWSPIASEATLLAPTMTGFWSGWLAGTLPAR